MRPVLRGLLLAAATASLVLNVASPGAAAGGDRATFAVAVRVTESVVKADFSGLRLDDWRAGTAYDRIAGVAPKSPPMSVDGYPCRSGSLSLHGKGLDWANVVDGAATGGILEVNCTRADGLRHRYFWGTQNIGGWTFTGTDYCLQVTRADDASTTTYVVKTPGADGPPCLVQEQVLDSAGKIVGPVRPPLKSMPISATFTVSGVVPVAQR